MEEKVNQFNMFNQSDLKGKHLFCAGCENWLIDEIYLRGNGLNYCKQCTNLTMIVDDDGENEVEEIVSLRNNPLEEIIANLKYPCEYEDCVFIGLPAQLKIHQTLGPHTEIKCHICEKSDFFMLSHLVDEHNVTNLTIDEPVATIPLPLPIDGVQIVVISLRKHTFVVTLHLLDGVLSCMVGSDTIHNSQTSNNYTICYEMNENKVSARGKIHDIKTIINGMGQKSKFFLPPATQQCGVELKVYFCNYDQVQHVIDECPICCNHLTAEIYQCTNGHCVCSDCRPKINTCPSCRVALQAGKFFLKHVLSNYHFPCTNADDGCLHLAKPSDLNAHLAECLYVKVNCVECNEVHTKLEVLDHLFKMHHVSNNLSTLTYNRADNAKSTSAAYIKFQQMIFRFAIVIDGVQNGMTFSCNVKLLYCHKDAEAQKYRYEVHLLDPVSNSIVMKLSNMCQIMADEMMSSTMQLDLCRKFLKRNEKQWIFNCKYFIFEMVP